MKDQDWVNIVLLALQTLGAYLAQRNHKQAMRMTDCMHATKDIASDNNAGISHLIDELTKK